MAKIHIITIQPSISSVPSIDLHKSSVTASQRPDAFVFKLKIDKDLRNWGRLERTIEVMYEKGVFKPLKPLELEIPEGTKVKFEIKDNSLSTKSLLTSKKIIIDFFLIRPHWITLWVNLTE